MQTKITVFHAPAQGLQALPDRSVDLVVTSPPYPMVGMWDECFAGQDPMIGKALSSGDAAEAFSRMHAILDQVWAACTRVLVEGGFACINIADATRTFDGHFRLFPNHARVIRAFEALNCTVLPDIHWRKPSNSPNKFMGSGMYPAGAYITYEHEYILIFRKGGKRTFRKGDVLRRRESAYFWEERNRWFSDLWEINGTAQPMEGVSSRSRSAAFPAEIPWRLVQMYSLYGDTVLDPFAGLGTTGLVCSAAGRNAVLYDIDGTLCQQAKTTLLGSRERSNGLLRERRARHEAFIQGLTDEERQRCYKNRNHPFLVKTQQERDIRLYRVAAVREENGEILTEYVPD